MTIWTLCNSFARRDSRSTLGISAGGIARIARAVFEWREQRTGLLTSNVAEAGGFIKSSPAETTPDLQLHFVIAKLVNHGRTTVLGHGYSCHLCVLRPQKPWQRSARQQRSPCGARIRPPVCEPPRRCWSRMVQASKSCATSWRSLHWLPWAGMSRPVSGRPNRPADRAVHPRQRRHHLPPSRNMPHGQRPHGCGGRPTAGARHCQAAGGRCVHHAAHRQWQHQCPNYHDCRGPPT